MASVQKAERPPGIQAFCILNFLGALLTPVLIIGYFADPGVPRWYPALLSVYIIASLLSLIGIWLMRRKALYVYIALIVLNQSLHLSMGRWNPLSLLLPLFLIGYGLRHIREMR